MQASAGPACLLQGEGAIGISTPLFPSCSPGFLSTHPHTWVLRHSTGPGPRAQGGTQFLGIPAGHNRNCIRSGQWRPRRSHCPVSCHSGVPARSCTAWRWFGVRLQRTMALRGGPHPSRSWHGGAHQRTEAKMICRDLVRFWTFYPLGQGRGSPDGLFWNAVEHRVWLLHSLEPWSACHGSVCSTRGPLGLLVL